MPRNLPFETEEENKKYILMTNLRQSSYDFKIQVPAKLGKIIVDKQLKVTIEVID